MININNIFLSKWAVCCSFIPGETVRAVLAPWLDVEAGQTGLHLGPGPVGLLHPNSTKQTGGYRWAGQQSGIQPEIFLYHNYLNISYEDQVVHYQKHQCSLVGLTIFNIYILCIRCYAFTFDILKVFHFSTYFGYFGKLNISQMPLAAFWKFDERMKNI